MCKPQVGLSSCIAGENVRFNGANCHKKLITGKLAAFFDYHPVCPEVSAGLPVPRPAMHLVENGDSLEVQAENGEILTADMEASAWRIITRLGRNLDGFILKKGSPSCGPGNTRRYTARQTLRHRHQDGIFATALKQAFPLLPLEDEGRLNDAGLREHFVKRVMLHHQARHEVLEATDLQHLLDFHTRHKLLLKLHHPDYARQLGQWLAAGTAQNWEQFKADYFERFMQAFVSPAGRGQHFQMLQRALRHINKQLGQAERADLQARLQAYYERRLPLAVPIELIRHYLVYYDLPFLASQSYLTLGAEAAGEALDY